MRSGRSWHRGVAGSRRRLVVAPPGVTAASAPDAHQGRRTGDGNAGDHNQVRGRGAKRDGDGSAVGFARTQRGAAGPPAYLRWPGQRAAPSCAAGGLPARARRRRQRQGTFSALTLTRSLPASSQRPPSPALASQACRRGGPCPARCSQLRRACVSALNARRDEIFYHIDQAARGSPGRRKRMMHIQSRVHGMTWPVVLPSTTARPLHGHMLLRCLPRRRILSAQPVHGGGSQPGLAAVPEMVGMRPGRRLRAQPRPRPTSAHAET
jgi:hypothetical protein